MTFFEFDGFSGIFLIVLPAFSILFGKTGVLALIDTFVSGHSQALMT